MFNETTFSSREYCKGLRSSSRNRLQQICLVDFLIELIVSFASLSSNAATVFIIASSLVFASAS